MPQYLHHNLPAQPSKLRARFGPDAVRAFRQRCLLAQLRSASLRQLSAQLAAAVAGSGSASGDGGGGRHRSP